MESIKNAIDILSAVRSTMDSISITGLENQDMFLGCANAIKTVSRTLENFMKTQKVSEGKEDENGG